MAKVLSIIAEYNPFHNGHAYLINKAKEITGCSYTLAVISGNFTQRGEPAIIDKWSRAEIALNCGVDLVVELPTLYATSSAENFADGAIKLLHSLKVIDYLAFGCENSNFDVLNSIANVLYEEPKAYKLILSNELKKGLSFPKARENALMLYLNDIKKYLNVLNKPNNILGLEYMKSLKKHNCNIEPVPIERFGSEHTGNGSYKNITNASTIRNFIRSGNFRAFRHFVPAPCYRNYDG